MTPVAMRTNGERMELSLTKLLLILLVVCVFFGAGRLPSAMGDLGRGLRAFRDGLKAENGKSNDSSSSES